MTEVRVTERDPRDERCPYCRDALDALPVARCPACDVGIHEECLRALKRCPTVGCQEGSRPKTARVITFADEAPPAPAVVYEPPPGPGLGRRLLHLLASVLMLMTAIVTVSLVLAIGAGVVHVATERFRWEFDDALLLGFGVGSLPAILGFKLLDHVGRRLGMGWAHRGDR